MSVYVTEQEAAARLNCDTLESFYAVYRATGKLHPAWSDADSALYDLLDIERARYAQIPEVDPLSPARGALIGTAVGVVILALGAALLVWLVR